jgi:hypothetical protein
MNSLRSGMLLQLIDAYDSYNDDHYAAAADDDIDDNDEDDAVNGHIQEEP